MRAILKPLCLVLLAIGVLVALQSATAQVANPPIHCFEVDRQFFAIIPGVGIAGPPPFPPIQGNLRRIKRLCNPIQPPFRARGGTPLEHLVAYEIRKVTPKFQAIHDFQVTDAFGPHTIDILRPTTLLVPTAKSLIASPSLGAVTRNHYLCFKIKAERLNPRPTVNGSDQFGTSEMSIKRAVQFCLAVSKNNEPIPNPNEHLMCYDARSERPDVDDIFINNQFGPKTINVTRSREFCQPATITQPTPCGVVDFQCAGSCPDGQMCDDTGKLNCQCVPIPEPCNSNFDGRGVCGGLCPETQVCDDDDKGGCECVTPPQPCQLHVNGSSVCGGDCDPGEVCLYDDIGGSCGCVAEDAACGLLPDVTGPGGIGICGGLCDSPTAACVLNIAIEPGLPCVCMEPIDP